MRQDCSTDAEAVVVAQVTAGRGALQSSSDHGRGSLLLVCDKQKVFARAAADSVRQLKILLYSNPISHTVISSYPQLLSTFKVDYL